MHPVSAASWTWRRSPDIESNKKGGNVNSPAKKAIVVGFDGASMELVKRMVDEGHMPNVSKLIAGGVYREMLGVVPTLTPPGWTTLATGAWAGTHKVTDFRIRNYDSYIPDYVWGINTDLCVAEYIWNTAERCDAVTRSPSWSSKRSLGRRRSNVASRSRARARG
jgi:hypothetical protein